MAIPYQKDHKSLTLGQKRAFYAHIRKLYKAHCYLDKHVYTQIGILNLTDEHYTIYYCDCGTFWCHLNISNNPEPEAVYGLTSKAHRHSIMAMAYRHSIKAAIAWQHYVSFVDRFYEEPSQGHLYR
jgi:hypothetical protein